MGNLKNKSRPYLKEKSLKFVENYIDNLESEFSFDHNNFYLDLDRLLSSLKTNEKKIVIERVTNLTSYREIGSRCKIKIGKTKARDICENFGKEFLQIMS